MNSVAVLDYGMGNLHSVCKALEHVAPSATIQLVSSPEGLRTADRVVFPGQGAIGGCIAALEAKNLREPLLETMQTKPFLGICLGLQALYEYSEEDRDAQCLGIIPGQVEFFSRERVGKEVTGLPRKVPHMGWNQVHQTSSHPLWDGIATDTRFYFVHSYYENTADEQYIAGTTDYGIRFTSAAAHENIFAVQFHPEKSQKAGLRLLENFMAWNGGC